MNDIAFQCVLDSQGCASSGFIIVQMKMDFFDARMIFQKLLQCNGQDPLSLVREDSRQRKKRVLFPVAPLLKLYCSKAQQIDCRFEQVQMSAVSGIRDGERKVFVAPCRFSLVGGFCAADCGISGYMLRTISYEASKNRFSSVPEALPSHVRPWFSFSFLA